jgi:hypothetical protein
MRIKPPRVPTGATGAGGTGAGPRVIPGGYTVKLTKGENSYTDTLTVTNDPRSPYTRQERKAQFDLTMRVYHLLEEMAFAVEQINGVRSSLELSASRITGTDSLGSRLRTLAAEADAFRKKIVATKEGGMVTGEERLREHAAELYGTLNGNDGPPTQTQVDRTAALIDEVAALEKEFHAWTERHLAGVNGSLKVLTREEWEKHTATE